MLTIGDITEAIKEADDPSKVVVQFRFMAKKIDIDNLEVASIEFEKTRNVLFVILKEYED